MIRAYKTKLDPNNKQRGWFVQNAGAARFVFNWALADRKAMFEAGGKPNQYEQKRRFNALKGERFPWITALDYRVVEQAFADVDTAYQNFFRRVKRGAEKKGFPKFKSRKQGIGGYTTRGCVYVETSRIKLPKIGWVRLKERGYLPTEGVKIMAAHISERAGRWFVSLQCECPEPEVNRPTGAPLGVDVGIASLAVCSDGTTFENPRALATKEARLVRLQREFSRRKPGSKNRGKTKAKIARCHLQIASARGNAIHETSRAIVNKAPAQIVIEDLHVKGMMKNHHIAKALGDASMSELHRQLKYKGDWAAIEVIEAGRFYASSKTCSACGAKKPLLKLSEREFVCEVCGAVIERDLNAAINLAALSEGRNTTGLPVELERSEALL